MMSAAHTTLRVQYVQASPERCLIGLASGGNQIRLSAFTLIELSIVLIIIGLLVGGVLAGRDLIRQSQIQSIIRDKSAYQTAFLTFKGKFDAWPGDYDQIMQIYPSDSDLNDGNGDGNVGIYNRGIGYDTSDYLRNESFYAWRTLALQGMIEGSYVKTALSGGGPGAGTPGINIPEASVKNAGFNIHNIGNISTNTHFYDYNYGNSLTLGAGFVTEFFEFELRPVLTPEEAWSIDKKLDDEVVDSGRVIAAEGFTGENCDDGSSGYNLSSADVGCALIFPQFLR